MCGQHSSFSPAFSTPHGDQQHLSVGSFQIEQVDRQSASPSSFSSSRSGALLSGQTNRMVYHRSIRIEVHAAEGNSTLVDLLLHWTFYSLQKKRDAIKKKIRTGVRVAWLNMLIIRICNCRCWISASWMR